MKGLDVTRVTRESVLQYSAADREQLILGTPDTTMTFREMCKFCKVGPWLATAILAAMAAIPLSAQIQFSGQLTTKALTQAEEAADPRPVHLARFS
jgi:hypothetical protein